MRNELRGPSPRLSAWATQIRRNVATMASRWRHCVDLTGPGVEPQTSRTDSVRLATELTTGGCKGVLKKYMMSGANSEIFSGRGASTFVTFSSVVFSDRVSIKQFK